MKIESDLQSSVINGSENTIEDWASDRLAQAIGMQSRSSFRSQILTAMDQTNLPPTHNINNMKTQRTFAPVPFAVAIPSEIYADHAETASQASSCGSAAKGVRRNKHSKKLSDMEVLKQARTRRHGKSHGRRRGHMFFN